MTPLAIVPRSKFRGHTRSGRKQWGAAPASMRPAITDALNRHRELATIDAAGFLAVHAFCPTWRTLISLLGVLSLLQLAAVGLQVLGFGPSSQVYAARRVRLGTKLDSLRAKYQQCPCLVYSGSSRSPIILRVPT